MGEILIEHVHRFDPNQFENLLALFAPPAPPAEPRPAQTPYDLGLEPWAFTDPRQQCEVVAYVDGQQQIRHVPTTRASEVPKAWRRVWLEPRE